MENRIRRPDPLPAALLKADEQLRDGDPEALVGIAEVKALFGLEGVSDGDFKKSTKYVSRRDQKRPSQLPRRTAAPVRSTEGDYRSAVRWKRREVLQAVTGWLEHLGVRQGSPF